MLIKKFTMIISLLIFFGFTSTVYCQLEEIELKQKVVLGTTEEEAGEKLTLFWPLSVDTDNQNNLYILD